MTMLAEPLETAPHGFPLVGHLPQLLRDRLGFLTRCSQTNAAVVKIRLNGNAYLLLDAHDIKYVLESNHANFEKSSRLTKLRGQRVSVHGLLASVGADHLKRRKVLQPCFNSSSIEPLAGAIVQETDRILGEWSDGNGFDAAHELKDLAQCISGRILFSADYRGRDAALAQAIRARRQRITRIFSSLLPFPQYSSRRSRRASQRAQQLIDEDIAARIAQRRAEPSRFRDMLGRLAATLEDDQAVHHEAVTTATVGYETIGEALAWTSFLLADHPHVQWRLAAEIADVLQGRAPTVEDLPKLRYAEMVINESMRLYPPTWIYVRQGRSADRLPSGVALPAGARIFLSPWVIHRSERYFTDPLRFNPLRFEQPGHKTWPKFAFFPFGGGPRICIGQALSRMEMLLVLAMIVQRFSMTLVPGQTIVPNPRITLEPYPAIWMNLARRS